MSSRASPFDALEAHAAELSRRLERRKRGRALLLVAAPFMAIIMFIAATAGGESGDLAEVREAAEKWADNGPASYTLTYELVIGGDTLGPATVVFDAGVLADYRTADPVLEDNRIYTVEVALFTIEAIAASAVGDVVAVEYDDVLGYARTVTLDPNTNRTDDEWTLTVLEFAAD